MNLLNTHYYDGKLISNAEAIKIRGKKTSKNLKIVEFNKLKTLLKQNQFALMGIDRIIDGIDTPANWDPSNKMAADELLYEICKKIDPDILEFLGEQLADIIRSGQCPQGRVTRLFQVYLALHF